MGTIDNNFLLRIQQGQREMEKLMGRKQYNLAMIKARQTLEYMVNYFGERALIVEGDLADSIDQLFEARIISQSTKDHYHRIRVLGNKAVHEGNDSQYDAGEAFQLLSMEVNAFVNPQSKRSQGGVHINKRPADVKTISSSPRNIPVRSGASRNESRRTGTAPLRTQERTGGTGRTGARPVSQRPAQRNVSGSSQRPPSQFRSRRRPKKKGFDAYELIKPALIFLAILVIVLITVKLIPGKNGKKDSATSSVPTESSTSVDTTTEAPTETKVPETEPPKIYTTNKSVNVRTNASLESSIIVTLVPNTLVEYVRPYDDNWSIINYNGREAYVFTQYLSVSEGEPGTVEPAASAPTASTSQ